MPFLKFSWFIKFCENGMQEIDFSKIIDLNLDNLNLDNLNIQKQISEIFNSLPCFENHNPVLNNNSGPPSPPPQPRQTRQPQQSPQSPKPQQSPQPRQPLPPRQPQQSPQPPQPPKTPNKALPPISIPPTLSNNSSNSSNKIIPVCRSILNLYSFFRKRISIRRTANSSNHTNTSSSTSKVIKSENINKRTISKSNSVTNLESRSAKKNDGDSFKKIYDDAKKKFLETNIEVGYKIKKAGQSPIRHTYEFSGESILKEYDSKKYKIQKSIFDSYYMLRSGALKIKNKLENAPSLQKKLKENSPPFREVGSASVSALERGASKSVSALRAGAIVSSSKLKYGISKMNSVFNNAPRVLERGADRAQIILSKARTVDFKNKIANNVKKGKSVLRNARRININLPPSKMPMPSREELIKIKEGANKFGNYIIEQGSEFNNWRNKIEMPNKIKMLSLSPVFKIRGR